MRVICRFDADFDIGIPFACLKIEDLQELNSWYYEKMENPVYSCGHLVLSLYSGFYGLLTQIIYCDVFTAREFENAIIEVQNKFQAIKEIYKE